MSQARADGMLIYVNPAYAQHFGLGVAAILGISLYDYVEPAGRGVVRQRLDGVLRSGERLSGENRMGGRSGDELWIGPGCCRPPESRCRSRVILHAELTSGAEHDLFHAAGQLLVQSGALRSGRGASTVSPLPLLALP